MPAPVPPRSGDPPAGPPWDSPIAEAPLAFVDLEMTGLDATKDRVLEVCVERVVNDAVVDRLETLVRPEDGTLGNETVHGIGADALATAPTFADVAERVLALLDGAVVVAHAAPYDVAFLSAELSRLGVEVDLGFHLDTLTLSRRAFGYPSHALAALAKTLEIDPGRAHRAGDDVRVLRGVFRALMKELVPATPRDLWHVKIGKRVARPALVETLKRAAGHPDPVRIRYRPSGKRPVDLVLVVRQVRTELDPPRVLGYLLPSRGQKELRTDRILSVSPFGGSLDKPGGPTTPALDKPSASAPDKLDAPRENGRKGPRA
jgi:DNA polymerase-3 subunit epsilon